MRILIVCLGNICRSPAAAAALREEAKRRDVAIEVDSAGTAEWHVGDPPHHQIRAAGERVGLRIDGSARQVDPSDFGRFDVILAMDASNHRDLEDLAPDAEVVKRIHRFRSFDDSANTLDVPDPWGGPDIGYDETIVLVQRAARGVIDAIGSGRLR